MAMDMDMDMHLMELMAYGNEHGHECKHEILMRMILMELHSLALHSPSNASVIT